MVGISLGNPAHVADQGVHLGDAVGLPRGGDGNLTQASANPGIIRPCKKYRKTNDDAETARAQIVLTKYNRTRLRHIGIQRYGIDCFRQTCFNDPT